MAGTREGNLKVRQKLIEKYGSYEAYLQKMRENAGVGGKKSKGGGFANGEKGRELARRAGRKSGRMQRVKRNGS